MDTHNWLAEKFEAERSHLRAVAYRMLCSLWEADDAVQESWLRLSRSDTSDVANLGGWLTTVVARVCLDMLRSGAALAAEQPSPPERGRFRPPKSTAGAERLTRSLRLRVHSLFKSTIIVALATQQAGRTDLIRSPKRVLA